jgi:hypothetical protein
MTGAARTNFLVSRVFGVTAGVADGGGIDAIAEFPKLALPPAQGLRDKAAAADGRLRNALLR